MKWLAIVLLVALAAAPATAMAGPADGVCLFLEASRIVTMDADTGERYAEGEYGGGFGYLMALGKSFSLGISVSEVIGPANFPTLPDATEHKVSNLAAEFRYWRGSLFAGYHIGTVVLSVFDSGFGSAGLSGGKQGSGFMLGVEGEGGWFILLQTLKADGIQVENGPVVNVSGPRLRLGYRWR